jgi:hypothetical protein
MHLAKKQLLREEMGPSGEIDKVTQYLDETMKIMGCDHETLAELFAEIQDNSTLQEYLTGKRVRKVVVPREMVSPSKRRVRSSHIGLKDGISQENLQKFDRFFMRNFRLDKPSDMYPSYKMSTFENNLKITNNFFNPYYRNTFNKLEAAPSLLPQVCDLNVEKLHVNSHLKNPVTTIKVKACADKENQSIPVPRVREIKNELFQAKPNLEAMAPKQEVFVTRPDSFRSDALSCTMSQSKYRLRDESEEGSESMLTYFKQL